MNKRRCVEYAEFFELQRPVAPLPHCRFAFISGAPGTGKTSLALDFARLAADDDGIFAFYMKGPNKWWDGYLGQKTVVMDEADPESWADLESLLKVWGDRYPFVAEVKGGSRKILPEWYIVTSNYMLEELTRREEETAFFDAMWRRAGDGERVFNMDTMGHYRPQSIWSLLREEDRRMYEDVFGAFVEKMRDDRV